MQTNFLKSIFKTGVRAATVLLLGVGAAVAQQQVNLTAGPATAILPDGSSVPMWGYTCGTPVGGSTATCAAANSSATAGTWSPVIITVPTGQSLQINLTNNLLFNGNTIPTSLVIAGQLGGGLGDKGASCTGGTTCTPSPIHDNQATTWPIANGGAINTPPTQGNRIQSFATEVAEGATTALTWTTPSPGTYLLESGTHPSIQASMGLIGMVVVTTVPSGSVSGQAYPAGGTGSPVPYNGEVPLIFSEIDPVQNSAVDKAVKTTGFSEGATLGNYGGGPVVSIAVTNGGSGYTSTPTVAFEAGAPSATATAVIDTDSTSATFGQVTEIDISNGGVYAVAPKVTLSGGGGSGATAIAALQLNAGATHCSGGALACYPSVVNYTPLFYLINGVAFNKTSTTGPTSLVSASPISGVTGSVLVRMVNAGSRMHVPAIVGSVTGTNSIPGMSLIAEDGNPLPGLPRVQNEVFMAAGKTYDVMINAPAAGGTALPVFDRELSLSGNGSERDAGMLAYISINGAGMPSSPSLGGAVAKDDAYNSMLGGKDFSISDPIKGVIANDINVYGVTLLAGATHGAVTLNPNGTFSYKANDGATADSFTYCANGGVTGGVCSSGITATVTLGPADKEAASGITLGHPSFTANNAKYIHIASPGLLTGAMDAKGYPLSVVTGSTTMTGATLFIPDAQGGFTAVVSGAGQQTINFTVQNSQGTQVSSTATVIFPAANGPTVTVVDGQDKTTTIADYRWIIEEDRTFYVDPTKTTNAGGTTATTIVPTYGTNFHTSYMPVVATGCTGPASCESGQKLMGQPAICDQGNGVCRVVGADEGTTQVDPSQVHLDPNKRYYISVLPGDAANAFESGNTSASCTLTDGVSSCGHGMGGAPIAFGQKAVTVYTQPNPYPPSKLSVFVFEDDFPLNGEQDAGGGVDILAPNEPGLGHFNITIFDDAGGPGDATGQVDYDMFNQPLSNSLAGTVDPATGLDACPVSTQASTDSTQKGIVGQIVTCPKYEGNGSAKILSPLAGQAVVANMMPGRYGIVATPGADRIAAGEEWLQTNTLDGQKAHDSFLKIGEAGYFQEYGPAGYHVAIGFANPKIINSRLAGVCNGIDINITGTNCTNTVTGKVTTERMSRTPDERLYSSGSNDSFSFTQCYISFGDPDGEDFAFTKCAPDGTFSLSGLPDGSWRITVFDQWNDMLVDGLSTPVLLGGGATTDMGQIATSQWQSNIYTSTFVDLNGDGVRQDNEPGLPFVDTNIRFRDGSFSNFNNTDLSGNAGFNEVFPLFNWYVIETDSTRYRNTGTHVVYDAGGPADGSKNNDGSQICGAAGNAPCGSSNIGQNMANTYEVNPVPANLHVPGAVYCNNADCSGQSIQDGPNSTVAPNSTGRIDPAWVVSEGWQGFSGQNNFLEFGKAPFADGENGGIHGHVVYASTRPFDDPTLLLQLSWEPLVPNVTMNLYQEGVAADGSSTLTLVDTTRTSSWDDWAQGFRSDGMPNMNCPGQTTSDMFYFTLYNQPEWLDVYGNNGTPAHAMPDNSQFKCFDGMHNWNQLQPAPYDGMYQFPSIIGRDPVSGKPVGGTNPNVAGTNCTICIKNPTDGTPMLPRGKYVVEVVVPPGYELVKEEDKNILIGDNFIAPVTVQFPGLGGSVFILPDQAAVASSQNSYNAQNSTTNLGRTTFPSHEADTGNVETFWPCVGEARMVPDYISLFPGSAEVAPFAGATRNLCDRKEVVLDDQTSALAKFYIFTSTHTAAHFTGVITDDFTSEFDPFSPQFGEKFAPPNLPVSIKDWTGTEISRVYTDQWGAYNGLTYSTWEVNPPNPTGYSPTMMVTCMNDPGTGSTPDPLFNPGYSQFCYEIPFMPGQTQYMDTPVTPTTAYSEGYNHPDCAYPDATPAVSEVDGDGIGPWVAGASGSGALASLNLTNGGSGYSSAPAVSFTGGTGSGAAATATISGHVQTLALTSGGSGYTTAPTVALVSGNGSGATATAAISGVVGSATVTANGSGYTSVPSVSISGGGGSGATGRAVLSVLKVNITSGGAGYTTNGFNRATVTFAAPPAGGVRATGTPIVQGGRITGVNINNHGSGYTSVPGVTFGGTHTSSAAGTAVLDVSAVTITASGSSFTSAPGITFTGGGGSGAAATANILTRVVSVTLVAQGSGYNTAPTVEFIGGGGSGAAANATISGAVAALTLNNPGSGYSAAGLPAVHFTGGGGTGAAANVTAANLSSGALTITALGDQTVLNNAYSGPSATATPFNAKTITRHYGFGSTQGKGFVTIGGKNASIVSWSDSQIVVNVPTGVPACAVQQQSLYGGSNALCGELAITTDSGKQSIDSVTVTIGGKAPIRVSGSAPMTASGPGAIQTAINSAAPGDLIIVPKGTYNEMLLMWKPVRLQGVGAASSVINANTQPEGKMDPWRRQVNCLFGLALNGQPSTSNDSANPGSNPFDPSGAYNCGGWTGFTGGPNNPQIDRLPLEGILGWDTTVNGNLAQLLQEPTLMGAYEGAGITVLGKGVNIPAGSTNIFGSGSESAFPTGTTLLTTANCSTGGRNPYPSNFLCNPSAIDALSITDSSQGGGGIFVHAWGHNLQIANNRVYNNTGTLTGGITVGQGEAPDAYLAGDTSTDVDPGSCQTATLDGRPTLANTQLPYCFDLNVNVHHNSVSLNSSIGDELFSSTPAGAGGVTMCIGADYYKFNFNWVCGNLSTGDGGGLVHLGFIYHGDIEHNSILFNQSTNPTVPTNGGGMIVMGAPPDGLTASGLECGNTAADADCTPGLSDGTGPGLVINANLLEGNGAESGSGGGIRFQNVNGTDVVNFPTNSAQWNDVTVTNNIINNNMAGWDGAGVSLQDALKVKLTNNTIASNDTTASSGVLFNTLGAPLASSQGPTCTSNCGSTSQPQPAGLVAIQHSPVLIQGLSTAGVKSLTCPAGHPNCNHISDPLMENDILWQNRAFYIGVGNPAAGLTNQQNTVTLYNAFTTTASGTQPTTDGVTAHGNGSTITGGTGACISGTSFWDIGVRGDSGPTNHASGIMLAPSYSVLSDITGYNAANLHNTASNPNVVSQYCNGSRTPPEYKSLGYQVPPGISDATVPNPVFNLTPAATVDEGNNWINISWGPLAMTNMAVTGANGTYGSGSPLGNYAPSQGSPVINYIPSGTANYTDAPTTDFFGNSRKDGHVDVGAVEFQTAPVNSVTFLPTSHSFGTQTRTCPGTGLQIIACSLEPTQDFTLTNTGNTNVTVTNGGAISGTNPNDFAIRPNLPLIGTRCSTNPTLAPGASCVVRVQFQPQLSEPTGAKSATLTIVDSAGTQTAALTGTTR